MVKVRIDDLERCPRYAARVLEGARIGPSPAWMQNRLRAVGIRALSNAVDVTNFVLMECGQPLHAFDLDKVEGRQIVVRRAGPPRR
jgi:phenylalanyl-tRNA synthetase beta chain